MAIIDKLKIAQFTNIILLFLVTGIFWGTWFSLSRSISSISPETFLETGQIMIATLAPAMPILFPLALLSILTVLFLLYKQKSIGALYLTLVGFLLFIMALLVTLLVNVPIDNQIKQWTISTLPSNWEMIRDRWQLYHAVRSSASLIGLGLVLAGALVPSSNKKQERIKIKEKKIPYNSY